MSRGLWLVVVLAACSNAPSEDDARTAIQHTLTEGKAPTALVGAFNYIDVPFAIDRVEVVEIGDAVTVPYMDETYYPVRARIAYRFEDGLPGHRLMRPNVHAGDYQLWRERGAWRAESWMWSVTPSYVARLGPPQPPVYNDL